VRRDLLTYLKITILMVALAARLIPGPRTIDDAFITFRYARNLLDGQGMVYNPGERVMGTTTALYTFLMAGIGLVAGGDKTPFPWISLLINAIADATTCWLLMGIAERFRRQKTGLAVAAIWAIAPMSVTFAIGGMETSVYVLLMTGTFYFYSRDKLVPAALLASFSLITRPDALLFIVPLIIERLRRSSPWPRINPHPMPITTPEFLAFLLPSLAWFAFATMYFGRPFPNSIAAKVIAYHLQEKDTLIRLLQHYATPFLGQLTFGNLWIGIGLCLYILLYSLGCLDVFRERRTSWAIFIFPCVYFLAFSIANPLVFRWYLTPPLPVYFIGIFAGIERVSNDLKSKIPILLAALLAFLLTLNGWTIKPDHGPTRPAPEMAFIRLELLYEKVAQELGGQIGDDQILAAGDIGALGYFTEARILDTVGLISPQVVQYYPLPDSSYVINYAISTQLILEQQPDYVVILEVYGRETLLKDKEFNAQFRLMERYETDLYGSEGMLVFQREQDS
jgi:uncharacterized membrane protein